MILEDVDSSRRRSTSISRRSRWADEFRRLKVRANADTPEDAAKAREFGAEGIGLCRTEHMFMAEDRLPVVREMIMASTRRSAAPRSKGCSRPAGGLRGHLRGDGGPAGDDPPARPAAARVPAAARGGGATSDARPDPGAPGVEPDARARAAAGSGCMLPEIYEMQVRAIVRAALAVEQRTGEAPLVEIMHPLVGFGEELHRLREITIATAAEEERDRLPRRHDDRAAAGLHPRGRDRRARRLLLVRDERPHADGARLLARRRGGQVPDALPRGRRARAQPVRDDRPGRGRAS